MDKGGFDIQLALEPDSELAEQDDFPFETVEIRKCMILARFEYKQFGLFKGAKACLLVINFDFVPHEDVKFRYGEVDVRLLKADKGAKTSLQPAVISYEPKRWESARKPMTVQDSSNLGGSAAITQGPGQLSMSMGKSRQLAYEKPARASIHSVPKESVIQWRLMENSVSQEGVPNPFQSALIVLHDGPFAIRLSFSVKVSKAAKAASWRRATARMAKPHAIDPADKSSYRGPSVVKLNEMEHEDFQLQHLILQDWDL